MFHLTPHAPNFPASKSCRQPQCRHPQHQRKPLERAQIPFEGARIARQNVAGLATRRWATVVLKRNPTRGLREPWEWQTVMSLFWGHTGVGIYVPVLGTPRPLSTLFLLVSMSLF